ncbi:hypothetical protein XENTR_v10022943 [Xenopus tropicalis]|nr:hypothetical protein XENTR_v10022943 [Xenopus tropicalis]
MAKARRNPLILGVSSGGWGGTCANWVPALPDCVPAYRHTNMGKARRNPLILGVSAGGWGAIAHIGCPCCPTVCPPIDTLTWPRPGGTL